MLYVKLENVLFSWIENNETREKEADAVKDFSFEPGQDDEDSVSFEIVTTSSVAWKAVDFIMDIGSDNYQINVLDPELDKNLEGKVILNFSKKDEGNYHILAYDPNQETDETEGIITLLSFKTELKYLESGPTFEIKVVLS